MLEARNALITYDDLHALLLSEKAQLKVEGLTLETNVQPITQVVTRS